MAIADADASLTALTRFGLGPTSDQIRRIAPDPRDFVQAQIADARPPLIDEPLPGSRDRLVAFADYLARRRSPDPDDDVRNPAGDIYRAEVLARARNAVATEAPFLERLVMFWSNFFAVAADKGPAVRAIAGAFEREAIRPHVLGRFADMLTAVTEHPAMLAYLDNNRSIGPHSRRGSKAGTGLNENLARETLELHSLGVDGGYSQADVTALANILTGWRTGAATGTPAFGTFVFDKAAHEPGSFAVLGKRYPGDGAAQGNTALADFAADPATAAHVARRLAAHFVADDPPDHIVATIAAAFEQSRGDLARVSAALVASDAAWSAPPGKFLPPFDFLVAAHRLTGTRSEPGDLRQGDGRPRPPDLDAAVSGGLARRRYRLGGARRADRAARLGGPHRRRFRRHGGHRRPCRRRARRPSPAGDPRGDRSRPKPRRGPRPSSLLQRIPDEVEP